MADKMRSVVIEQYGSAQDVLQVRDDTPVPEYADDEVLIKVYASAVNPVDCTARSGYGRNIFVPLWGELPLILGRDISGVVAAVGNKVTNFKAGDEVYAAPHIGCYAEYAVVKAEYLALKPRNISHQEAASLPFVGLTTWTALVDNVGLKADNCAGKKIVIPRAAGGVGSFAVQLMKSWGAYVAAICSSRSVNLVKSLGADVVIDYKQEDFSEKLSDYDIAFDTVGKTSDFEAIDAPKYIEDGDKDFDIKLANTLKKNGGAAYVTICSPKMMLTDKHGLKEGSLVAEKTFQERAAIQKAQGRRYYWSFFNPSGKALAEIAQLVESNQIRAVVDRVYPLEDIAAAHMYCETKQAQGKIVIDIADS